MFTRWFSDEELKAKRVEIKKLMKERNVDLKKDLTDITRALVQRAYQRKRYAKIKESN